MRYKSLALGALGMCLGPMVLSANATPIVGVTYPTNSNPSSGLCNKSACVGGYQFTVTAPITITGLGTFDGAQGNPSNGGSVSNLTNSETVDLFNSTGAIIATTNVGAGVGTQVGSFFAFSNLTTPLALTSGTYTVAALLDLDDSAAFPSPAPNIGSGITFNQFEYCDSGTNGNDHDYAGSSCSLSTSSFLSSTNSSLGFLGANIEYNLGVPAPVPEPLTLSLFGAGLAGAAAMRRRRKTIKA